MRIYFFYVLIAIGIMSVFYFSWIESPRLSLNGTLPKVVSSWADKQENENLRTGIPFFFISVIIGLVLIVKKKTMKTWGIAFLCVVVLVFLAEIGQLFLPLRRFDWKDIFWGIFPAFIVLGFFYAIKKMEVLKL